MPQIIIIVSDLFGSKHLGANYLFYDGNATMISSLGLGKYLVEAIYQRQAKRLGDGTNCYGPHCFAVTHMVCAFLCGLGAASSMVLAHRSLPTYRRLHWRPPRPGGA